MEESEFRQLNVKVASLEAGLARINQRLDRLEIAVDKLCAEESSFRTDVTRMLRRLILSGKY